MSVSGGRVFTRQPFADIGLMRLKRPPIDDLSQVSILALCLFLLPNGICCGEENSERLFLIFVCASGEKCYLLSGIVCFLNHGFSKKSGVLSHLFDVGRVLGRRFQHLFGFYLTNVDNMSDFAY